MNIITRILEKVFHLDKEEQEGCRSCEHLRLLIEQERSEKAKLLNSIIELSRPKEEVRTVAPENLKPIKPRFIPWEVRRAELEANDRKQAQILKEQGQISVKDLESEMLAVDKELEDANQKSKAI
jgi:hypothetical protein